MRSIASTTSASSLSPTPSVSHVAQPQGQRSPWHSPVPYLFGGLAAMLGLIAFALLILACSYWRLAGQFDEREGGGARDDDDDRDLESGTGEAKEGEGSEGKVVKVYEEKILVIMAGDENPTFLATPVCAKTASFSGGIDHLNDGDENKEAGDKAENCETMKKGMGDQLNDHHHHASTEENGQPQETPEAQDHNQ